MNSYISLNGVCSGPCLHICATAITMDTVSRRVQASGLLIGREGSYWAAAAGWCFVALQGSCRECERQAKSS
jgi:hypothetical protein